MKRVLSGIKPSSDVLHLGHYFGAIKQWLTLQEKNECFFAVVDLHALTTPQEPKQLQKNITNLVKTYLASGLNPQKVVIFKQSEIAEHTQLFWILTTITKVSELFLMTQYKDKVQKEGQKSALAGLLNYPILMAADILLYDAQLVPVGEDQIQHLELTREIARRFNQRFGETFVLPQPLVEKVGARIMALDDPTKKMSKSDKNPFSFIALTDKPELIKTKIKKAVTDSENRIKYDPIKKPGISNLLTIMSLVTRIPLKSLEKKYQETGYALFKEDLAEAIIKFLSPFQTKYNQISSSQIEKVLSEGRKKAKTIAQKKIQLVYQKIGLR